MERGHGPETCCTRDFAFDHTKLMPVSSTSSSLENHLIPMQLYMQVPVELIHIGVETHHLPVGDTLAFRDGAPPLCLAAALACARRVLLVESFAEGADHDPR